MRFKGWTMEDVERHQEKVKNGRNKNRAAVSPDNMEQTSSHEPLGEKKVPRLDSPCRIHLHSRRHRLTDSDGVSGKAAIDGLVHCGLLPDDSPEFVTAVSYSQEKVSGKVPEETEIVITW